MCNGISNNKNTFSNNYFANLVIKYALIQKIIIIFAVFVVLGVANQKNNFAYAEDGDNQVVEEIENQVGEIINNNDFSQIEEILAGINDSYDGVLQFSSFKDFLYGLITGSENIEFSDLFSILKNNLLSVVKDILSPLILIFIIVCLCNFLSSLSSGKMDKTISEIIYFLCLSIIVIIVSVLIKNVVDLCADTILGIQKQVNAVFPILLSLMSLIGATSSASVYSPVLSIFSTTFISIFSKILLPIFSAILLICIVSKLTKNQKLGNLSEFFSSLFKWIMGTSCTVFMSVLSLQGITASTRDGLSIKAAKFAMKNYIPMLGGYISDGYEVIKAGGVLVKNALGFASIFLLFFTLIKPICYLCVLSLGLKLISGMTDIIDNIKIGSMLHQIANALKMLVAIVVGVSAMYFFILFLLVCTGNVIL